MTWKDCARAACVGALALAVDVLILSAAGALQAVAAFGQGASHGAPGEWAVRIAGPYVLGGLVWAFSVRRPDRNPCPFALWVWVTHVAMYGVVLSVTRAVTPAMMMTMALKLVGALIGASLAMTSLTRSED